MEKITLSGDSAGGNLAINAGYAGIGGILTSALGGQVPCISWVAAIYPAVDPQRIYETTDPVFGNFDRSFTSKYLGGSPEEFLERYAAASSFTYINPNAPPMLILVRNNDHIVPIEGTAVITNPNTALHVSNMTNL